MSQKSYDGSPTLYLIPTPIGNMEDITLRALQVLKDVEVIFSEDTRVTRQLLNHFGIKKKLISNHNFNENTNYEKALSYLQSGFNIGLVTDRGTPVISDPGYDLACYVIKQGYHVVALPGATALIPALIVSGLAPAPFLFYGFLNSKLGKRKKELEELKKLPYTLIFYEAPHRIYDTLMNIWEIFGDRQVCIAREITKKYEEVYRGSIENVSKQILDIKGEIVLIVNGNFKGETYDNLTIVEHVNLYIKEGNNSKEAIKMVARDRQMKTNEVYRAYHLE